MTVAMKTKIFTVLTNRIGLLVSRNAERNLKTNSEKIASAANCVGFSPKFVFFRGNFCLRNGTELVNDSNYR